MDTSNSNRGVKRKKNETPSEIHKRIKVPFACPHCLREYTNHPHLTAHIVNFHKKLFSMKRHFNFMIQLLADYL